MWSALFVAGLYARPTLCPRRCAVRWKALSIGFEWANVPANKVRGFGMVRTSRRSCRRTCAGFLGD